MNQANKILNDYRAICENCTHFMSNNPSHHTQCNHIYAFDLDSRTDTNCICFVDKTAQAQIDRLHKEAKEAQAIEAEKAKLKKTRLDEAHVKAIDDAVLRVLNEFCGNTNNAGILLLRIKHGKAANLKIEY